MACFWMHQEKWFYTQVLLESLNGEITVLLMCTESPEKHCRSQGTNGDLCYGAKIYSS